MRFNLKMPEELKQLYKKYENSKVGRELLKLTGISREQLDIFSFFDKYFNSDLVDITIDPNGNVGNNKSNSNLIAEASNSIFKLAALVDMFNYLQKIGYSKEKVISIIDKVISGALYAHDQTKWSTVPYCIAVSSYHLMVEGRPYGQLHSLPPKRADSFMAQVVEYVMDLSQEFAGAVAIGDLAVNYAYYVANSKISDKQIENDYQKFVHVVNNNFRINAQSPFTNISFFDEPTLKQVFKDYRYPDGSSPLDEPYLSTIKRVQKIWMEFVARKDPKTGFPYRFPVHTVNITVDNENKVIDRDFFDLYCSLNKEGIFNVYIVNDGNAKVASCCRILNDFKELLKYRGIDSFGNGGINIGCYDDKTEVLTNHGWKLFKDLKKDDLVLTLNMGTRKAEFQKPTSYFEYDYKGIMHSYQNENLDLLVTPNHNMFLESRKTKELLLKRSDDFGTGYNMPLTGFCVNNNSLGFISVGSKKYPSDYFCKLVGLFIADGTAYSNNETAKNHAWEIRFTFKKDRKIAYLQDVLEKLELKYHIYKNNRNHYIFCIYGGEELHKFFRTFYTDNNKKCINKQFLLSLGVDELNCLFDGLIEGDGHRHPNFDSTIFYTSSDQLKDDFCMLCSLMGLQTTVRNNGNPRCRETFFKKESRFIQSRNYEIVVRKSPYLYRPSKYRKEVPYEGKVYCVEVPNHVLMVRRNGKTCWCGNSHRVVTINLPRIALEAKQLAKKSSKKYGIIVEKLVRTILITRIIQAGALLVSHRELLKDRINQGFLKFFKPLGWLDLDRMFFSTVGLVGIYEFAELLGYDLTTKEGIDFIKDILVLINDKIRELSQKWGVPFNVEQIPGETAAITLAKKDKLLYNTNYVLYSNQFIPLWKDILLTKRIEIDGMLDEYFGGGVISHLNVGKILSTYHVKRITEYAIEKGLRHFALNLVFSRCKNGHVVNNDIDVCPTCGSTEITKLTRIVGYFVPINNWVKERREWEFKNRVWQ